MNVSGSHTASRNAPRTNERNPAVRRAPMSHAMVSAPNARMYQAAFHFVPTARPRNIPAATCHLRSPSRGPDPPDISGTPRDLLGEPGPGNVPVDEDAAERGQDEEHQEDVEDPGPREHELQAVQRHQQSGDAAEQRGPGHPAGDPAHQQDGQRAEHRAGEPPAERVQPEQPLAHRDEQLADLRLHHVLPARRVPLQGAKMFVCPAWMRELALLTRFHSTPWCRMLHASLA